MMCGCAYFIVSCQPILWRNIKCIFKTSCDTLARYEEQSGAWIDLRWPEGGLRAEHIAVLEIVLANDAGVLGRICTLIGEQKANITDIVFTERKPDFYRMVIEIEVRDVKHLLHVQTAVEADTDVTEVVRYRSAPADRQEHLLEKD